MKKTRQKILKRLFEGGYFEPASVSGVLPRPHRGQGCADRARRLALSAISPAAILSPSRSRNTPAVRLARRWKSQPAMLAVWVKPAEDRNDDACNQGENLRADGQPVPDRRDISFKSPFRRGCEQPVHNVATAKEVGNSPLGKAGPERAAAIEAQIDGDDPSENFIKEKLHSRIRSSRPDAMTASSCSPTGSGTFPAGHA